MADVSKIKVGNTTYNVKDASAVHDVSDRVPTSRTVNGKPLSSNISLTASDVGAASSGHNHDGTYLKSVPAANNSSYGGIKTGFSQNSSLRQFPVTLAADGKAYVQVGSLNYSGTTALTSYDGSDSLSIDGSELVFYNDNDDMHYSLDCDRFKRLLALIGEY